MKRYAKCINNYRGGNFLTVGKVYEILKTRDTHMGLLFYVTNDHNTEGGYEAKDFKSIGCPCNISVCVKHRIKQ
jgi:hypothetical protein